MKVDQRYREKRRVMRKLNQEGKERNKREDTGKDHEFKLEKERNEVHKRNGNIGRR